MINVARWLQIVMALLSSLMPFYGLKSEIQKIIQSGKTDV